MMRSYDREKRRKLRDSLRINRILRKDRDPYPPGDMRAGGQSELPPRILSIQNRGYRSRKMLKRSKKVLLLRPVKKN